MPGNHTYPHRLSINVDDEGLAQIQAAHSDTGLPITALVRGMMAYVLSHPNAWREVRRLAARSQAGLARQN